MGVITKGKPILNLTKKFKIDEQNTTLNHSLLPEKTGIISGDFIAQAPGSYRLTVTLQFNESKTPIIVKLMTQVIQVLVQGENTQFLPDKIGWRTSHSLVYNFINPIENQLDATQINLSVQDLKEIKLIRKNLGDTDKEKIITLEELNTADILHAGEVLTLSGVFVAETIGENKKPRVIFKYAEGPDILFPDKNQLPTSEVVEVAVQANINKNLPNKGDIGETQLVQFCFINQNKDIPASELELIITEE